MVAEETKDLVCLGYTHYQPAQPTTIGKRMTLYIQDLLMDLEAIDNLDFRARGAKGTVGTQASYLKLFDGNYSKVRELDLLVAQKLGFEDVFPVTGQTYPRKFDSKVAEALAGIGVSLGKFAGDLRLLSNQKCVDEPFELNQTGSSAMPYKRNPMRSERLSGLTRKLRNLVPNFYDTAANQWFERTLDDSAIRRIDIPQAFLLTDASLILGNNITDQKDHPDRNKLTFYPQRLRKLLNEELPFMASEEIIMDLVKEGYDRQDLHEIIKQHSFAAGKAIKEEGRDNDLFTRLGEDKAFPLTEVELNEYLEHPEKFAGAAEQQVEDFLVEQVGPALDEYEELIGKSNSNIEV